MGNTDKRIMAEKEQSLLNELVPKVDALKKEIESKQGVVIYAMIRPVGMPIVNITKPNIPLGFWGKHVSFIRNRVMNSYQVKLQEILKLFYDECNKIGVIPVAKINENGAEVFFMLTQEKRKEISPLVIPNTAQGKGILVPQGIMGGK